MTGGSGRGRYSMSIELALMEEGDSSTSGEGAGCLGDGLRSIDGSARRYEGILKWCYIGPYLYQDVLVSFEEVTLVSNVSPSTG